MTRIMIFNIALLCLTAGLRAQDGSPGEVRDSIPFIAAKALSPQDSTAREKRFGKRLKAFPSKVRSFFSDEQPKPKKALWMSFVLPGAGQAYNGKHWKIPIVYGGLGALGYAIGNANRNFRRYKRAYIYRLDEDPGTEEESATQNLTDAALQSIRNGYRDRLERYVIFTALFYTLIGLDAFVDAHLQSFRVDEDLSIQLRPSLQQQSFSNHPSVGMGVVVEF